jgi:hypothetical protein
MKSEIARSHEGTVGARRLRAEGHDLHTSETDCVAVQEQSMRLQRIPECVMATRADRLHSIGDFQQQSRIFVVTGSQRFQAEISQCPGKCIEALPILLYQRVYLRRLQLDARRFRFGSDGSRLAIRHHQQVAPFHDSDCGPTHVEPLLCSLGKQLMNALPVRHGFHRLPDFVGGRIDDQFHDLFDGGVDWAMLAGIAGTGGFWNIHGSIRGHCGARPMGPWRPTWTALKGG